MASLLLKRPQFLLDLLLAAWISSTHCVISSPKNGHFAKSDSEQDRVTPSAAVPAWSHGGAGKRGRALVWDGGRERGPEPGRASWSAVALSTRPTPDLRETSTHPSLVTFSASYFPYCHPRHKQHPHSALRREGRGGASQPSVAHAPFLINIKTHALSSPTFWPWCRRKAISGDRTTAKMEPSSL